MRVESAPGMCCVRGDVLTLLLRLFLDYILVNFSSDGSHVKECTIPTLKRYLVEHANDNLLRHDEHPAKVAKAWV